MWEIIDAAITVSRKLDDDSLEDDQVPKWVNAALDSLHFSSVDAVSKEVRDGVSAMYREKYLNKKIWEGYYEARRELMDLSERREKFLADLEALDEYSPFLFANALEELSICDHVNYRDFLAQDNVYLPDPWHEEDFQYGTREECSDFKERLMKACKDEISRITENLELLETHNRKIPRTQFSKERELAA